MRFVSTRGGESVAPSDALRWGLAPDGGLFVPTSFPTFWPTDFDGRNTVAEIGAELLRPFLAGPGPLAAELDAICRAAFDFPVPLTALGPTGSPATELLELYWGPTAAFKDFGARFLAQCYARTVEGPLTIVVATSGDTGGAVAAAFHRRPGVQVVLLYPKGLVSARQEQQLLGFGDNVRAFAVEGPFDACQALARAALANPGAGAVSSANSINVGRLLPQMAYYAAASLWRWRRTGRPTSFVVPTGNLGNATAALWARKCGLPIERVVLATNANRAIPDWLAGGSVGPRPTIPTLANAMDVGLPSNLERVRDLCGDEPAKAGVTAHSVGDEAIRGAIVRADRDWGAVLCPHTATALVAWEAEGRPPDTVLVGTAHPAKFEGVVEPLIGRPVALPDSLRALLAHPAAPTVIRPTLSALSSALSA